MRRVNIGGLELAKPRLRSRDLVRESLLSIGGHPARSLLTAIGTVLGAAAFVSTLGLSSTMAQQVSSTFDLHRATEVTVKSADEDPDASPADATADPNEPPPWQARAALGRLSRLSGVDSAGRRIQAGESEINRFAEPGALMTVAPVTGIDSEALAGVDPHITQGRTFDPYHDRAGEPVALLPANVARELGVTRTGVAVYIDSRAFTVIGIFDDVTSRPEILPSVVAPYAAVRHLAEANDGATPTYDVIIKTAAGAAQLIGRQAPLALAPHDPTSLRSVAPPDPQTLRMEVETNVEQLSLILSAVALAIGAVSIGNAATASIAARVPEIGLRSKRPACFGGRGHRRPGRGVGAGLARHPDPAGGCPTTVIPSLLIGDPARRTNSS